MGTVHAKDSRGADVQTSVDGCAGGGGDSDQGRKVDLSGIQARVDKINVEGLQRTKDDIVIETVSELFKARDFQQVIVNSHKVKERLEKLGCFQNIGIFIDTSSGKGSTMNGLEVTFFVKELKRMLGGISTLVGNNEGSLCVGLRAPNLFGRGEKIEADYSYGSRRTNNLSLSFIKPLRTRYNALFTASVFQHGSDWPWSGYKVVERGLLLDLGFNSTCSFRHNLQYEGFWREMGTSSRSSAFDVRIEAGHKVKSAVRHILTIDKTDALIFPTKGFLFRFTTEYAGLGGDLNFLKNDFYGQINIPIVSDIVLQGTIQGGYLQSIGNEEEVVGLPDKMYLGGPMTVRGFQTRGIGPRSEGVAIGTNAVWGAGIHLFTPLPFRPGKGGFGDLFRIHLFGNLGQCKEVDENGFKTLFENYRMSFGGGIAMRLGQLARVEFNYVVPHIAQEGDVVQEGFQVGFGAYLVWL